MYQWMIIRVHNLLYLSHIFLVPWSCRLPALWVTFLQFTPPLNLWCHSNTVDWNCLFTIHFPKHLQHFHCRFSQLLAKSDVSQVAESIHFPLQDLHTFNSFYGPIMSTSLMMIKQFCCVYGTSMSWHAWAGSSHNVTTFSSVLKLLWVLL
jgi:hypothetical protein